MASWSIWDKLFMPLQSVSHLTQILHEWLKQCFLVICFSSLYGELVVKWILQEHCKCLGWNIGLGEIKQQQANVSVCNFVFQDMMMREKELEYFREWEKQEDSVRFTDHTHFCVLPFPVCLNLICVQAHTRMHMHTHAPTHAHIHTCTHTYTHTRIHTCMHPYTHACMHACKSTHAHIHTRTHTHTHTTHTLTHSLAFSVPLNLICTHSCLHEYTHTHRHIHTQKHFDLPSLFLFSVPWTSSAHSQTCTSTSTLIFFSFFCPPELNLHTHACNLIHLSFAIKYHPYTGVIAVHCVTLVWGKGGRACPTHHVYGR